MINSVSQYKMNNYRPDLAKMSSPVVFFNSRKDSFDTVSFGSKGAISPSEIVNFANEISGEMLKTHLFKIASEETEGRAVGGKGIEVAKKYIVEQFAKLNLEPVKELGLDDFCQNFKMKKYKTDAYPQGDSFEGGLIGTLWTPSVDTSNILGMIKGKECPDKYVIVMAHYDHLGKLDKRGILFPGADDNASSVSALLEIARVMKKNGNNKKSVIFAALSGEESGEKGSKFLAKTLSDLGIAKNTETINVEMIGATGGDTLDLWAENPRLSQKLITGFKKACRALKVGLNFQQGSPNCDAIPFDVKNLPTVTTSWDYAHPNSHPYYHMASDTPEKVNMSVFEKAAKTISAAIYVIANKISVKPALKDADSFVKTKVA